MGSGFYSKADKDENENDDGDFNSRRGTRGERYQSIVVVVVIQEEQGRQYIHKNIIAQLKHPRDKKEIVLGTTAARWTDRFRKAKTRRQSEGTRPT